MTTSYYAARNNLFQLMRLHPDWSQQQFAQTLGRSKSWVYKWQKRFASVPIGDEQALHQVTQGQSRARKHPSQRIDPAIEALILSIRDEPLEGLRRTPGRHPPFSTTSPGRSRCGKVRCVCRLPHAPSIGSLSATSALST